MNELSNNSAKFKGTISDKLPELLLNFWVNDTEQSPFFKVLQESPLVGSSIYK